MKTLTILGLMVIIITAPRPCFAAMWMTSYDWFYASQFKMPQGAEEAEELKEQITREEKAIRESYVRGVIDTLMLLNTVDKDAKEMLDGLMNLTVADMSGLVTRIYMEQPQYQKKPVIFILGHVMPRMRARLGKPRLEQLKGEETSEVP
ncbi:MAG: hypothetical protein ACE5IC_06470 [Candidatus Brocadiales bacterium]